MTKPKVSDYLKQIAEKIMADSGYPYPDGSKVDPSLALAYGYAAGLVMGAARQWEEEREQDAK